MGINLSGPKLENLMNGYVDAVPVLPEGVRTGEQIAQYYEQKHMFTEASLFNNPRFEAKINQVAQNEHEKNQLWHLSNLVNLKVQKSYEIAQ